MCNAITPLQVLRFLRDNCTTDGGSYLLHKDGEDGSIRLFDLAAITDARQRRWKWLLAMLAFR